MATIPNHQDPVYRQAAIDLYSGLVAIRQDEQNQINQIRKQSAEHARALGAAASPFTAAQASELYEVVGVIETVSSLKARFPDEPTVPISVSRGSRITTVADALHIAAVATGHEIATNFSYTPLVVSPTEPVETAIKRWEILRKHQ